MLRAESAPLSCRASLLSAELCAALGPVLLFCDAAPLISDLCQLRFVAETQQRLAASELLLFPRDCALLELCCYSFAA